MVILLQKQGFISMVKKIKTNYKKYEIDKMSVKDQDGLLNMESLQLQKLRTTML